MLHVTNTGRWPSEIRAEQAAAELERQAAVEQLRPAAGDAVAYTVLTITELRCPAPTTDR